ncbi:hypothetical protein CCACVL1_30625 [Corchorus capsularis]|uniref:non-specific serine/threonine protein kinase n=1 Tax=Corchorus capsularis TaxID=210143 RepID=A0A1R3FW78_COCAP|nr:hypothetical protein CCACVL1_30625 [Corchorus capsularis]
MKCPPHKVNILEPGINTSYRILEPESDIDIHRLYTFGRELGRGISGITYSCTEIRTGIEYACKSIAKTNLKSMDEVENVRNEIRVMEYLSGVENIVKLKGVYEDASCVHIVMEMCSGGDLFDLIKEKGRFNETEAAELMKVIVGVVAICHTLGIMHRDLKPENFVLLNKDKDGAHGFYPLKAIDFGLSAFFKPETLQEQLCKILKGQISFESEPWPQISDSAKDLIRRMLCLRPSERLTARQVLRFHEGYNPPKDEHSNSKFKNTPVIRISENIENQKDHHVLGHKTPNIRDLYMFGPKLGQGQTGTTYVCTEIATGTKYACKSISKQRILNKEDAINDVRREVQIMKHLAGQQNIVKIKDAYEDPMHVHIVMELCSGGDLFDRIKTRSHCYSEREAAELIKIIVGVVKACHLLGVMHRDLKPENFMLVDKDDDFSLKAIDFGHSTFFEPETKEAVFDEILKGHIDFESKPWPQISDDAKDLIKKMLCPKPSERLTAAAVLN